MTCTDVSGSSWMFGIFLLVWIKYFSFEIVLESCSSPMGHTSDVGPWTRLKLTEKWINQSTRHNPARVAVTRETTSDQKSFGIYNLYSFVLKLLREDLYSCFMMTWRLVARNARLKIFLKTLRYVFLAFELHPANVNSKYMTYLDWDFHCWNWKCCLDPPNYWSAALSIRSLPLRSPASLTIEQLASEQHLLLLGRCCCWPVAAQCCCSGWDVVVCCWTSLQQPVAGTRLVHYQLPVSA